MIGLLRGVNQPLTLEPRANLRQLPKDDGLYQSFLSIETKPIDEAYKICLGQHQLLLVSRYLQKIVFCIGLTIVPITYFISEWIGNNKLGDSMLILIEIAILPISWIIAFLARVYSIIFFGLLLTWGIYAVSLSGRLLPADTLLLFSILVYLISVCSVFIADHQQKDRGNNSNPNFWSLVVSSIFIIFALGAMRSVLPFVGSFTILLVVPALLAIRPMIGCLAPFIAIPVLIVSAIAERYLFVFSNYLLISCFFGLDVVLLLLILVSPHNINRLLNELSQRLAIAKANNIPFPCKVCGSSMEYINSSEIDNYLSYPQQVARSIDSMQYLAWRCPQCYQSVPTINLRGYIQSRGRNKSGHWFEDCPTCQERTMVCRQTLTTESNSKFAGIKVKSKNFNVERNCACCNLVNSYIASEHYIH